MKLATAGIAAEAISGSRHEGVGREYDQERAHLCSGAFHFWRVLSLQALGRLGTLNLTGSPHLSHPAATRQQITLAKVKTKRRMVFSRSGFA
jgi:hypothetical protein